MGQDLTNNYKWFQTIVDVMKDKWNVLFIWLFDGTSWFKDRIGWVYVDKVQWNDWRIINGYKMNGIKTWLIGACVCTIFRDNKLIKIDDYFRIQIVWYMWWYNVLTIITYVPINNNSDNQGTWFEWILCMDSLDYRYDYYRNIYFLCWDYG